MNRYIASLKTFLQQTPAFGYDDAQSVLEMLYYYYTTANPIDNALIRCQYKELDGILSKLSFADNNAVFSITVDLCTAHARQAFLEGVQVGMGLFTELCDLS